MVPPARFIRHLFQLSLISILMLAWAGCANPTSPDGGPKDVTPPEIVGIFPEPNSVGVKTLTIRFSFNKHVDRNSFQQSLFISPVIPDLEYVWRGRDVELKFYDSLRVNTTYSVTVGSDVHDTRERTRMSDSFTLAFSTGPEIDIGVIGGRVIDREPAGIYIFAFLLADSVHADTLNPAEVEPDYITQSGTDGSFRLPYLRFGTYRILAVRDQFRNRLYDRLNDAYGVYRNDISITEESPEYSGVIVRVHKPDLTEPFVSRVTADNRSRIVVRFSKQMDPDFAVPETFTIVHASDTTEVLPVYAVSARRQTPTEFFLFTEAQDTVEYVLTISTDAADRFGNVLLPDSRRTVFRGNPEKPGAPAGIDYLFPANNSTQIHLDPEIAIQFSVPVYSEIPELLVSVSDTNNIAVDVRYAWRDESTLAIVPLNRLESLMKYTIAVRMDSLPPVDGLVHEDSLYMSTFTTIDRALLGTIEGSVRANDQSPYTVKAERVPQGREPEIFGVTIGSPGPYSLERIPQGTYTLWGFRDNAAGGEYDFGEIFPFRGSAPFTVYPDTVRVRARWTVDGINLDFGGERIQDSEQEPEN